jgi:hypothetical protein
MARLVVWRGSQFDADNLPPFVDASECVPAAEWFAANRTPQPAPAVAVEKPTPAPSQTPKRKR